MKLNTFALTIVVACCGILTAAHADSEADALLQRLASKTKALKSLTAKVMITMTGMQNGKARMPGRCTGTMRLQRPNLAFYSVSGELPDLTACDGKTLTTHQFDNTYQQMRTDKNGTAITSHSNPLVNYFFTQEPDIIGMGLGDDTDPITRCLPVQKVDGVPVQVVEMRSEGDLPHTHTLYIGADGLLRRWDLEARKPNGDKDLYSVTFTDLQTDKPKPPASFAYTPSKEMQIEKGDNADADLLAVGEQAPDFTLPTLDGAPQTLSAALKGHKATLIDFWFWRCLPCQEEMPRLQAMYDELKAKGLNILTVNIEDSPEDIRKNLQGKALQDKPFTLPILFDKHSEEAFNLKYGVDAGPTNFILDENGKVVFRMTTFGEKQLRRALRKMGIQ